MQSVKQEVISCLFNNNKENTKYDHLIKTDWALPDIFDKPVEISKSNLIEEGKHDSDDQHLIGDEELDIKLFSNDEENDDFSQAEDYQSIENVQLIGKLKKI